MSTKGVVSYSAAPNPAALLQKERENPSVDPINMNYFLEGSKERSVLIRSMVQQMERDPVLATNASYYHMTKDQERELTALKIGRLASYIETDNLDDFHRRLSIVGLFDPQVGTRLGVNLGLFLSCIRGNGTAEQLQYWAFQKETVYIKGIYGCFGMTEMAHGSNVMGLETTATFDKENDEFVINTPHIGATKWWIGGAAHSATHCTVYARLIVDGEDYGVKTFVVPLRDANHNLMPGVTVGDIGPKMGRDGIDNGWIQFSDVRIPRFFMLQKFCKVSRDGDVTLPPLEQLAYSALLGGRVMMVLDSYRMSARFVTVALRYAVGRRQFKPVDGSEESLETQLINYPLHQRRLFPYLAQSYVMSAAALKLETTIENTLNDLDVAVESDDLDGIMKSIDEMKSLFIDSSSLKATCTWLTAELIDQCRQTCGGHGYSSYSGFGKAYNDWVVQCTWEGDNTVLCISIGKPLVKHVIAVLNDGKVVKGSSSFLTDTKDYLNDKPVITSVSELHDLRKVLRAIEVLLMRLCYQASTVLKANKGSFDHVGGEMLVIGKLKAHHYMLKEFIDRVENVEDKSLVPHLLNLGRLYGASHVLDKFSGDFLAYSVLTTKVVSEMSGYFIPDMCKAIRPHCIMLSDSFQQSDMLINSSIGNYDGNIYENYFSTVKANNPPSNTKAPYSAKLEALLNRASKEVRDRGERSEEAAEILSK